MTDAFEGFAPFILPKIRNAAAPAAPPRGMGGTAQQDRTASNRHRLRYWRRTKKTHLVAATLFAIPMSSAANETLVIISCLEVHTCNQKGDCRETGTRLMLGELKETTTGFRYLVMGPMSAEAGGGTFYAKNIEKSPRGAKPPSPEVGSGIRLTDKEDGTMWAFVYRRGREVPGFNSRDWVRADYQCEQVLY